MGLRSPARGHACANGSIAERQERGPRDERQRGSRRELRVNFHDSLELPVPPTKAHRFLSEGIVIAPTGADAEDLSKDDELKAAEKEAQEAERALEQAKQGASGNHDQDSRAAEVQREVERARLEAEKDLKERLREAQDKLLDEKASRLREAEQRLDKAIAAKLKEAEKRLRSEAEDRTEQRAGAARGSSGDFGSVRLHTEASANASGLADVPFEDCSPDFCSTCFEIASPVSTRAPWEGELSQWGRISPCTYHEASSALRRWQPEEPVCALHPDAAVRTAVVDLHPSSVSSAGTWDITPCLSREGPSMAVVLAWCNGARYGAGARSLAGALRDARFLLPAGEGGGLSPAFSAHLALQPARLSIWQLSTSESFHGRPPFDGPPLSRRDFSGRGRVQLPHSALEFPQRLAGDSLRHPIRAVFATNNFLQQASRAATDSVHASLSTCDLAPRATAPRPAIARLALPAPRAPRGSFASVVRTGEDTELSGRSDALWGLRGAGDAAALLSNGRPLELVPAWPRSLALPRDLVTDVMLEVLGFETEPSAAALDVAAAAQSWGIAADGLENIDALDCDILPGIGDWRRVAPVFFAAGRLPPPPTSPRARLSMSTVAISPRLLPVRSHRGVHFSAAGARDFHRPPQCGGSRTRGGSSLWRTRANPGRRPDTPWTCPTWARECWAPLDGALLAFAVDPAEGYPALWAQFATVEGKFARVLMGAVQGDDALPAPPALMTDSGPMCAMPGACLHAAGRGVAHVEAAPFADVDGWPALPEAFVERSVALPIEAAAVGSLSPPQLVLTGRVIAGGRRKYGSLRRMLAMAVEPNPPGAASQIRSHGPGGLPRDVHGAPAGTYQRAGDARAIGPANGAPPQGRPN
ncbi:unnamed protein product [Prorocentrum cordatum]|uniref:Uncharacterized protein n=1 Tax=Prorocentrum cordatum TaxID=2364126 RepID=A0ABN9QZ00_9DINO|nr:unnamed protein product [Polarella glacialis]